MSVEVNHPSMGLKSTTPSNYQRHDTNENEQDSSLRQERSKDKSMNQRYVDEQDMPEYIQMLEEHQAMCEREGRYVEAEIAKNRVTELRNQLESSKKEELKERHMLERQQLEEEHLAEMVEFNDFWDKKMEEFNQQAALIEEQMMMRHQEEMAKFTEELDLSIPTKPKDSGELLNLRKIQQTLAKQKDYIEAHKVQQRCMKLEREEMEKWQVVRDQKIRNQRIQLEHKHNNEMNAIRKRISTGQEEQAKARTLDLERFLHKYQNMRKELTVRQQAEIMQVTKSNKSTTGSIYGSTYRSQSSKSNLTNGSLYKSNSKQGEAFKRQPLQDSSNINKNKTPVGRPLGEKMKKNM